MAGIPAESPLVLRGISGFLPQPPYFSGGLRRGFTFGLSARRSFGREEFMPCRTERQSLTPALPRPAASPQLQIITQRASGDPELNSRKKADSLENDSPGLPKRFAKVTMNCQAGHRRIRGFFSGPTRDDAWPKDLVPRNGLLRYTFL